MPIRIYKNIPNTRDLIKLYKHGNKEYKPKAFPDASPATVYIS